VNRYPATRLGEQREHRRGRLHLGEARGAPFERGAVTLDDAWAAAHVDEDWNMELWGRDELALVRRAARFAEMQAAARVLELRG